MHALSLVALTGLLSLSACVASNGPLRLYQRNDGDIVTLHVGEVVEVVLRGNPSTNIVWLKPPDGPDLLEQIGTTEYKTDLEANNLERRLMMRFRATAPGRTRLQLVYQTGPARDETLDVWIVVRPTS